MAFKGRNLIAAAVAAAVALAAWLGHAHMNRPRPTPLSGFSAPFVFGRFSVPEANPLTRESVELGRRLFYDTRLSGNNQVSCATCHVQRLAFTDGRQTAVGVSGKPLAFNSMSLTNLMWGPRHFFWNGRSASLEEQALVPIQHQDEMDQDLEDLLGELASDPEYVRQFAAAYGDISAESLASALASFERTLISSNSRYDQFLRGERQLSDLEEHGRKLFMAHPDVKLSLRGGNCIDCHSQFLTSGFNTIHPFGHLTGEIVNRFLPRSKCVSQFVELVNIEAIGAGVHLLHQRLQFLIILTLCILHLLDVLHIYALRDKVHNLFQYNTLNHLLL